MPLLFRDHRRGRAVRPPRRPQAKALPPRKSELAPGQQAARSLMVIESAPTRSPTATALPINGAGSGDWAGVIGSLGCRVNRPPDSTASSPPTDITRASSGDWSGVIGSRATRPPDSLSTMNFDDDSSFGEDSNPSTQQIGSETTGVVIPNVLPAENGAVTGGELRLASGTLRVGAPPPKELICPITQELFRDPVSTMDGQVYERAAIELWLSDHDTSPLTGVVLASKALIPQYALRALAHTYLQGTPADASNAQL